VRWAVLYIGDFMCTTFVYRNKKVIVGMNFDNDGKKFKISDNKDRGFLVTVRIGPAEFPTIGINANGLFINDQMVDSNTNGIYKRQNEKRWVTSTLVNNLLKSNIKFDEIITKLKNIEIVNAPNTSTHNLIVDRIGNICVVEPGKTNVISRKKDSKWFILTNFPISNYNEIVPKKVTGSGSDRYLKTLKYLEEINEPLTIDAGFTILRNIQQKGPEWTTVISILYDATEQIIYYCQDRKFEEITIKKLT
jgi:hypothetical protein